MACSGSPRAVRAPGACLVARPCAAGLGVCTNNPGCPQRRGTAPKPGPGLLQELHGPIVPILSPRRATASCARPVVPPQKMRLGL